MKIVRNIPISIPGYDGKKLWDENKLVKTI